MVYRHPNTSKQILPPQTELDKEKVRFHSIRVEWYPGLGWCVKRSRRYYAGIKHILILVSPLIAHPDSSASWHLFQETSCTFIIAVGFHRPGPHRLKLDDHVQHERFSVAADDRHPVTLFSRITMRNVPHRKDLASLHIFEVEGHQGLLLVLLQPLEGARRNSHTIIKPILAKTAGTDHTRYKQAGLPRVVIDKVHNPVIQLRRENAL